MLSTFYVGCVVTNVFCLRLFITDIPIVVEVGESRIVNRIRTSGFPSRGLSHSFGSRLTLITLFAARNI